MKYNNNELIVVGGGIIGTAIAFFCSREGMKVTLIEAGDLAAVTSGASHGTMLLQSKMTGYHTDLGLQSLNLFYCVKDMLPLDTEFERNGSLYLIENEEQWNLMQEKAHMKKQQGVDIEILPPSAFLTDCPIIKSDNIIGGSYCAFDGVVSPYSLTLSFAKASEQLGAVIIRRTMVTDFIKNKNRIIGVKTDKGDFYAGSVVLATGINTRPILEKLGIDVPLTALKGQTLVTEPVPYMTKFTLHESRYLQVKYDEDYLRSSQYGVTMGVHQTERGNLIIGATKEINVFDRLSSIEAIREIVNTANRFIDVPSGTRIIRTFGGIRPNSPDALPIIGPLSYDSLYLATGHGGDGIALSSITGKLVFEILANKPTSIDLEPLRPDRFNDVGTLL